MLDGIYRISSGVGSSGRAAEGARLLLPPMQSVRRACVYRIRIEGSGGWLAAANRMVCESASLESRYAFNPMTDCPRFARAVR